MPNENGRPEGANWLTPYITVADADASLDFYQRAFCFEPGENLRGPDSRTVHAGMNYQGVGIVCSPRKGRWVTP